MLTDTISRQAAIDAITEEIELNNLALSSVALDYNTKERLRQRNGQAREDIKSIEKLPSAQQWHVIEKRPMTEDERTEWSERLGYDIEYADAFIYSNLPDDGEAVLISSQYGVVDIDTFCQDEEGCYFEDNGDMDGIVAWMPLPEPYKERE